MSSARRVVFRSLPLAAVVVSAVLAPHRSATAAGWVPVGPESARAATVLAADPHDTFRLYAGGPAGVLRSLDGGGTWSLLLDGLPELARVTSLAVDPRRPTSLYAGTEGDGVFMSPDGGLHWRPAGLDLGTRVRSLAVDPADSRRLLAGSYAGIFESTDGAGSWRLIYPPADQLDEGIYAEAVAFDPLDPDAAYALGSLRSSRFFPRDRGLLLGSKDGGRTWTKGGGGEFYEYGATPLDLAFHPSDPSTLFLAIEGFGALESRDAGESMSWVGAGLPDIDSGGYEFDAIAVDPDAPAVLYLGQVQSPSPQAPLAPQLFKSADCAASWFPAAGGLPERSGVLDLLVTPPPSAGVFAALEDGLYRSTDGAASWHRIATGVPAHVTALAAGAGALLAGTDLGSLFIADAGPASWRPLARVSPDDGRGVLSIAVAPSQPETLHVAVGLRSPSGGVYRGAVYRSGDGGASWAEAGPGLPAAVAELVAPPWDAGTLFARIGKGDLYRSEDGGASWSLVLERYVSSVVVHPGLPGTVYAARHSALETDPLVYRSPDGGATWTPTAASFPATVPVQCLAIEPGSGSTLYAAAGEALFRSDDAGASWRRVGRGLSGPVTRLVADAREPGVLWAGTAGTGVHVSRDRGETWSPVSYGLRSRWIEDLVLDPRTGEPAVATAAGVHLFRPEATGPEIPPEDVPWITDPAYPSFRFKVRIHRGDDRWISAGREPECLPETVCFSGAVPGRTEVLVRVVGPKPNGWLWPTLVKLTTSKVEVWIERPATGTLRYYGLPGARPGYDELPGRFDRFGFPPG